MHVNIISARHGVKVEDEERDAKSFFYQFRAEETLTAEDIEELRDQFLALKDTQATVGFRYASLYFGSDNRTFEIHPVAPASLVREIAADFRGGSIAFFRVLCSWLGCEEAGALYVEPDPALTRLTDGLVRA